VGSGKRLRGSRASARRSTSPSFPGSAGLGPAAAGDRVRVQHLEELVHRVRRPIVDHLRCQREAQRGGGTELVSGRPCAADDLLEACVDTAVQYRRCAPRHAARRGRRSNSLAAGPPRTPLAQRRNWPKKGGLGARPGRLPLPFSLVTTACVVCLLAAVALGLFDPLDTGGERHRHLGHESLAGNRQQRQQRDLAAVALVERQPVELDPVLAEP
jgi:hypothetical protein